MIYYRFLKKGLSPLVATILLLAFSVSMLTAAISWKENFSTKNYKVCPNINFDIVPLNDAQLCYKKALNNIQVDFIVRNTGNRDINGMSMLIIGNNNKKIQDLKDINIKKNSLSNIKNLEVEYNLSYYGSIHKIYLTPLIEYNGISDICRTLMVEINNIDECS